MRYTWLDDRKDEIIERYAEHGESVDDIAEDLDVARNTIYNRLHEWDVQVGKRYRWLDEQVDEIVERYVERRQSVEEIADHYGTTVSPIKTRLKEEDIPLRPWVFPFSTRQRSVVEGELLGDGCIYRRHESACHFRLESTCRPHAAYVREQLPDGVFPDSQPYSVERTSGHGDERTQWVIYSRGQGLFDEMHDDWYEEYDGRHRKVVPDDYDLDETALLHWYLGDGCLSIRPSGTYRAHLSTHGFPEESVRRLQSELDSMGYENYTAENSNVENGSGLAIYISRSSSDTFVERLSELNTIEEYEYKFDPEIER